MVLVTHGNLADEFVAACIHVVGPQDNVQTVCIGAEDDMDRRRNDILKAVAEVDTGDGVVVLTDLFGGTPSNLAISIMDQANIEVIAGINLAFVGLFYAVFLPKLGRAVPAGKLVTSRIILYAVGQLVFIIGMFIAGGMGAARKVMGTAIDMDQSIAVAAAGIRDLGGGLAIIGGVIFIYIALKALLRKLPQVNVETN